MDHKNQTIIQNFNTLFFVSREGPAYRYELNIKTHSFPLGSHQIPFSFLLFFGQSNSPPV